jgi:hypothetical protein
VTRGRLHPPRTPRSKGLWPGSSPPSTRRARSPPAPPRRSPTAPRRCWSAPRVTPSARAEAARAHQERRRLRLRARAHGHRPGAGDAQGAGQRAGLELGDIDVIELNEAFASQSLAVIASSASTLKRGSTSTAAPSPSAIRSAPPGRASPARRRRCCVREGKRYALATQCIGGGQGIATILEAV